jgi:hypothetical protein
VKTTASGSVSSLVYGISSIAFCWVPVAGLVLGLIAIRRYRQAEELETEQPDFYKAGGLAVAGFVCGILGTMASSVCTAVCIRVVVHFFSMLSAN